MFGALFVFLTLCICCSKSDNESEGTIDDYLGHRYEFNMFENVEGCASVYRNESKVVNVLSEIKIKLLELKNNYSKTVELIKRKEELLKMKRDFNADKLILESLANDFPIQSDLNGAIKAMFLLHYTHYLNITKAVTEGVLTFSNHFNKEVSFQVGPKNPLY